MNPFLTLHDPARARAYYAQRTWRDDTFYDLMASHATARPHDPAIADADRALDWAELRAAVDGMADALAEGGMGPGDRLSIWMSDRVEVVMTFLACCRLGVACNPSLHRSYTCAEIAELLARLDARVLVTEPGWGSDRDAADFKDLLAGLPSLDRVISPADFPGPSGPPEAVHDNPDSVIYLAFTSGTTGQPKCVMHSCNTLLANARDLVADWGLGPDDVMLTLSPLSHHIGWVAVAQWLVAGCCMVLEPGPTPAARLNRIEATGATYVLGVPTHAMDILAEQRRRGAERIGAVRTFYMAGSPIPEVVAEAFVRQGITPQNIYGMTESSSHQYTHPGDPQKVWTSTCGRGGPGYEVRIFDQEDPDRPVPAGEIGQIGGRGGVLMLGYFDDQKATERSFNRDGWFLSGDLGSLDADGNLRIEGRLKDLIIRGGHNIYPARIEALALRHEGVAKAAVFGVADARLGEKVCLAVVGAPGAGEILAHLAAEGLSKYDMPEFFLKLDAFPMTASGKTLKRAIETRVKDGALVPEPVRYSKTKGPT